MPILAGGYESTRYPQEIMTHDCYDFLCAGGAENFVVPFLKAFEKKKGYKQVPNLYYRSRGKVVFSVAKDNSIIVIAGEV